MEKEKISEKILDVLKGILRINTEHKNISHKQYKKSMPKWEQRLWYGGTILVMFLIGVGIIHILSMTNSNKDVLKIEINPPKIILNEKEDINLEIKFTNIGKTNISDFDILKMDLYRIEDGKPIYKRQVIISHMDGKDYIISCSGNNYGLNYGLSKNNNLGIGESCTIKTKIHSCPECFDDDKKEVQLYVYINSVPPMENQIVTIPIY